MIDRKTILKSFMAAIRPLVRFSLRHGLKLQDITECFKILLIEIGTEQIIKDNDKVTDSRVAVMTGVHRKDIQRLKDDNESLLSHVDLITRLIGQWQHDKKFILKSGSPKPLTFGFDGSEFNDLFRKVNKELSPATGLFELERIGAVKIQDNKVTLIVGTHLPNKNLIEGFEVFSGDLEALLDCVEENVLKTNSLPNSHLRTSYDKIREENIEEIKAWLLRENHAVHAKIREFISQFDQDINPVIGYVGKTAKIIFGSFSKTYKQNQ